MIGFSTPPDADSMKRLVLLKNAAKETLRLYHPREFRCTFSSLILLTFAVGLNVREALTDTFLPVGGGADGQQPVAVLKGDQVGKIR